MSVEILAVWQEEVTAAPLVKGAHSWTVTALKELLEKSGKPVGNDSVEYDDALVAIVGPTFDGKAAAALLKKL